MTPAKNSWSNSIKTFGDFGCGFQNDDYLVFFGNKNADLAKLQSEFPQLSFRRIRQTHSDIVIDSVPDSLTLAFENLPEADAHFTAQKNQSLLILTADCLPIMIYCRQTHRVAAVHAGWRGVENRIAEKTLAQLIRTGSDQKDFLIWVGPHIQQDSFEAGTDAFNLLSQAHRGLEPNSYFYQKSDKYFIDLNLIVKSQIDHVVGKSSDVWFSDDDTKANPNYFSYRRDQKTKLRNLSFIALF
ncbi:polyphenol oxidase family protein [Pseudobdellovibrio exovorus]|uniref:Purine nucleoside phosphorylase n=1 Tax=Pseudobdellovibrio exovorus JSS TaxID=1184267 RepID=M4V7D2_9BACT|nr:polyphenol oxidase family protein [Pseudobdellovibrio exovorus]AGH94345.1 hypothetical protein A11Q_125 [Pseudobdellovibrio exovorus JSS]